jgi:hypothetical protein
LQTINVQDNLAITKIKISQLDYLALENADISFNDTLVVHFRMATQGSPCPANTHGFTITNNFENDFEKLEGNFYKSYHIFHNGGYSGHLSKPRESKEMDFSDTKLITKNLFRKKDSSARSFAELMFLKRRGCFTDQEFNLWINNNVPILSHNKTTILSPEYGLLNIGNFVTDDNGFIHSHGGYIKNKQFSII